MIELVKLALENNGIIACKNPSYWKNIYPNNTFIEFKDTIHAVFDRPVYIYGLTQYINSICKSIEGWSEEDEEWA